MKLQPRPVDPLLWDFELPLRRMFHPVGFPAQVVTNSPDVLLAAEESWGKFQKAFGVPPVQIRIGVVPGASKQCPPPPQCRGQRNLISNVADAENYIMLDTRQGFVFGWLTEAAVRNRAYLRYHFLEGPAWIALECLYLTPIHAACLELDGHGVLLCGDGGAGKSSLAYACAQNGWTFLSDDSSCLVRNRKGRVVTGNPYQMRFRESATELFPELSKLPLSTRLSGELSIELATASVPEISIAAECEVDYLVFLNRLNPEPEGLFRFPKNKAARWLEQVVCYGEKRVRDEHRSALRELISAEVFEMRYSRTDSALRLLEGLIRGGPKVANERLIAVGEREDGANPQLSF